MTTERMEGPTPAGGSYSEVSWFDANQRPCDREQAAYARVCEYDADGQVIATTSVTVSPEERVRPR